MDVKRKNSTEDFHTDKWSKMTKDERLSLLQKLENTISMKENRQARTIVAEDMSKFHKPGSSKVTIGYYSFKTPDVLHLNEMFLEDDSKFGNYIAARNVLHEGRHAYQDDVVRGKIPDHKESDETVELWKMNHAATGGIYYLSENDWSLYRFQPVEDDANIFASMNMQYIEKKVSNDISYQEYSTYVRMKDSRADRVATMLYGANYREEICKKLEQDYQNKYKASQINSQSGKNRKNNENLDASDSEGMGM